MTSASVWIMAIKTWELQINFLYTVVSPWQIFLSKSRCNWTSSESTDVITISIKDQQAEGHEDKCGKTETRTLGHSHAKSNTATSWPVIFSMWPFVQRPQRLFAWDTDRFRRPKCSSENLLIINRNTHYSISWSCLVYPSVFCSTDRSSSFSVWLILSSRLSPIMGAIIRDTLYHTLTRSCATNA